MEGIKLRLLAAFAILVVGVMVTTQPSQAATTTLTINEKVAASSTDTFSNTVTLVDPTTVAFQSTITNSGDNRAFKIQFSNDYGENQLTDPKLVSVKIDTNGDGTYERTLTSSELSAVLNSTAGQVVIDFNLLPGGLTLAAAAKVQLVYSFTVVASPSTTVLSNIGIISWSNSANGTIDQSDSDKATAYLVTSTADTDADTITDGVEVGGTNTATAPIDSDSDGTANYQDTDSNGDGTPDSTQVGSDPASPVDSNGNGVADYTEIITSTNSNTNATTNANTNKNTNSNANTSNTNSNTNKNNNAAAPTKNTNSNSNTNSAAVLAETGSDISLPSLFAAVALLLSSSMLVMMIWAKHRA